MTALLLGPLLRHVGEHEATIWLETDAPASSRSGPVTRSPKTGRSGSPATTTRSSSWPAWSRARRRPTRSCSTAALAWPLPESPFPASRIRTIDPGAPVRLLFGSCREPGEGRPACRDRPGRAQRLRPADGEPGPRGVAGPHRDARRPDLRRRHVRRPCAGSSAAAATRPGAARRGRRLRGVHRALLRGLGQARDPLAPGQPAERDDLRRPRRPRRLEHVPRLADGHAAHGVVGGADHRRPDVLLGLSAPGQPVAGRPRGGRRRWRPSGPRPTARPCFAPLPRRPTARPMAPRARCGRIAATSAVSACS